MTIVEELGKTPQELLDESVKKPSDVTLGTDPEFFVVQRGSQKVIPAAFVTGAKKLSLYHGTLMSDGAAVEMTVAHSNSAEELAVRTWQNITQTARLVSSISPGARLSVKPVMEVAQDDYEKCTGGKVDKSCALDIFGCTPDRIIYEEDTWERPLPTTTRWRSLGGHIHFGYPQVDDVLDRFVTALLDWTLGVTTQIVFYSPEQLQRRTLYGRAGTIRRNSVTLEYRVLSAQQLVTTQSYMTAVLDLGQRVVFDAIRLYVEKGSRGLQGIFGWYKRMSAVASWINIGNSSSERLTANYLLGSRAMLTQFSPEVMQRIEHILASYNRIVFPEYVDSTVRFDVVTGLYVG